jgi:sodium/proline symporter
MKVTVWFAFLSYVLLVIVVGVIKGWRTRATPSDFLNSSRDHRSFLAGLSAGAACESGWVLLGLVGTAYTLGVSTFWLLPGALIGYVSTWALVGERFRRLSQRANTTSTPQTLAASYPQFRAWITFSAGLIVLVFMSVYVASQFNASGKAFESMLDIPYVTGVWLSLLLVLSYSIFGGTRSVSWTNLIQASMMVLALIVMPLVVLFYGGHAGDLFANLAAQDANLVSPVSGKKGWDALSLILGWVFIGIAVPGMPHVLRRFIASKNEPNVIKRGGVISVLWSQVVFIGAITLGLAARAYKPGIADPEKTLPVLALELLPGLMAGFMLAAVWAAMSSTADAQLLEAVSAVSEDLHLSGKSDKAVKGAQHNRSNDKKKPLRALTIIIGGVAAFVASTENRNIFTLVLDAWNVLGASLAPPILFTLLYRRTSGAGVLLGVVGGAVTVFVWRYIIQISWLSPLVAGFVVSAALVYAGSKLLPDETRSEFALAKHPAEV